MSWSKRLPCFFTWIQDSELLTETQEGYLQLLETLFLAWLEKGDDSQDTKHSVCEELYFSLAPPQRSHFLSAPLVSAVLLQRHKCLPHVVDCLFQNYLHAELTNSSSSNSNHLKSPSAYTLQVHDISIDADGYFGSSAPTPDIQHNGEIQFILRRLARSLKLIGTVNGTVLNMIQQVLEVILIQKDDADANGFSSSSWPSLIGKMALTNPHRSNLDDTWIIDALVHESIHSFLYRIECFETFYTSTSALLAYKAVSPWSGKTLYLHSYVHACFVWFGLWCFWSLAAESEDFPGVQIEFFRERSRRGFLKQDVLANLGTGQKLITEPIRLSIESIQKIALHS